MGTLETEFLAELDKTIARRRNTELAYQVTRLLLMATIAGCGFLTAAASRAETKASVLSGSTALLIFGLLSAVCAIVNQAMSPAERRLFHKSVKKALQSIRGAVKFGGMAAKDAEHLRAIAVANPEGVLRKLEASLDTGK